MNYNLVIAIPSLLKYVQRILEKIKSGFLTENWFFVIIVR